MSEFAQILNSDQERIRVKAPALIKASPVRGPAIDALRLEQGMFVGDAVYMYGFRTVTDYNLVIQKGEPVDYQVEFLYRLYREAPGLPPMSNVVEMAELFKSFFTDGQTDAIRRSVYMSRFAGIFGCSKPTVYRWLDRAGEVNPQVRRIVSKLLTFNTPRARAEAIAAQIHAARGTDFELTFPLPRDDGKAPLRRGRRPTLPSERHG